VTPTFRDPALDVTRNRAGQLAGWIGFVIAAACVVTFAAVTIGVDLVVRQIDRAVDRSWIQNGLTFVVAFGLLAAWLPPSRMSRALRLAVHLPALHAGVIALAWPAWTELARFVTDPALASPLATGFPLAAIVTATLAANAGFALLVARPRTGEWLHGFVMLALCELLVLGLWLPISCAAWPGGSEEWWAASEPVIASIASRVLLTAVPPLAVACAFTALGLRRPSALLALRGPIAYVVLTLLGLAVAVRLDASARVLVLYANLMPILLVAVFVAVLALVLYGAALAVREYRLARGLARRRRTTGLIVADDAEPAIGLEITSWLRGPRTLQRTFSVSTADGMLPVHGAHLVATLPLATTQLRVGEAIAVLRPGDHVTIAGYDAATGDPFRTSAAPIAGELFVAPVDAGSNLAAHVALAIWRPCVAYLLIVVAVAIPALAALSAS
jgi:hypothetical protein